MMNLEQLTQMLRLIHQRNSQSSDNPDAPSTQAVQPQDMAQQQNKNPFSLLGFIGGLGDTKNAQGGVDPSWFTQANQFMTGQQQQPLPWQQPVSQQFGQQVTNGWGSSLNNFLSRYL